MIRSFSKCTSKTLIPRLDSDGLLDPVLCGSESFLSPLFWCISDQCILVTEFVRALAICSQVFMSTNHLSLAIHSAVYDYLDEGSAEPRHGTRVSSLAEKPIPVSEGVGKSRREDLGLNTGVVHELPIDTHAY